MKLHTSQYFHIISFFFGKPVFPPYSLMASGVSPHVWHRSPSEIVHHAVSPGVCVVDGPHGGACRKLPVPLCHWHGRRSGDPVPRELGQLPAFPAAQRLPPFGLWVPAFTHIISLSPLWAALFESLLKKRKKKEGKRNTNVFLPLFCTDHLCNGKFHKHLQDLYAPLVVRYVDLMESSITQSIHKGFERESWEPVK